MVLWHRQHLGSGWGMVLTSFSEGFAAASAYLYKVTSLLMLPLSPGNTDGQDEGPAFDMSSV